MENETQLAAEVDEDVRRTRAGAVANHEATPLLSAGATDDDAPSNYEDVDRDSPWLGARELEGKPWWKKPSVFWLLPPLVPFTIAFGGIVVPKINLIISLVCRDYLLDKATKDPTFTYLPVVFGDENPQCQVAEVQAAAARIQLYSNLISGTLAAIVSPRLGALSDRYGRNKLIAVTALGTLLGELATTVVAATPETASVNVILFGYFLDGLGGSVTTTMALMHSYASDCSPPERRNVAFGYFQGALFGGIAMGPLLAGFLIKWTGQILILFIGAMGCHVFFLIFLIFFIPESLSKERQRIQRIKHRSKLYGPDRKLRPWSWADLNPLNLLKPLSILYPKSKKPSASYPNGRWSSPDLRRNLILLAAIDTVLFGVGMGSGSIIIMYAEYMFGWGNVESSLAVSAISFVRVAVLVIILPIITRIFRGPRLGASHVNTGSDKLDITLIKIAVLFELAGYIGFATVGTGSLFAASAMVSALGGFGSPTLQSSLTQHVHPDSVGKLLGVTGLLHALSRVVAPTTLNLIYSLTVGTFPQAVFVCLVALFVLSVVLSLFIKPHIYINDSSASDGSATVPDTLAGPLEPGPI